VVNIAPVVGVMEDLKDHPSDYGVFLEEIESEEERSEILSYIHQCSDFLRHHIQSIIENVNLYIREL
jgi:hypothetical protein